MSAEIQKLRDEQIALSKLLLAGHPEQRGLKLAISDLFMEELLILAGVKA
jgi:hypothetical protein